MDSSVDKYKPLISNSHKIVDDIVDVILKAEQYQYVDLKQRTIQKIKNILYSSSLIIFALFIEFIF